MDGGASPEGDLDEVRDALVALEPLFHQPQVTGRARGDVEALMAPDFWEVGASGVVYLRDHVLRIVGERYADDGGQDGHTLPVDDVRCRRLGPSTYLLTYRLHEPEPSGRGRITRRATVWERAETGVGWRVVYHQGTVVNDG